MSLIAAIVLLFFASGRWTIALAAWLSPIFLLRFVRGGRALPRLAVATAALYGVGCLTWWGVAPVPVPAYFAVMLIVLLPTALAYVVGHFVPKRDEGFATTLVFPSAWVASEAIVSRLSPYGSWGAVAYTQVDDLPLMQSAAVTGLWGVAFLIAWTASVANWAWERDFDWTRVSRGVAIWGGALGLVLLAGGARLALDHPAPPTVRVASFTIPPEASLVPQDLLGRPRSGAALEHLRGQLHTHHDSLFAAVRREARAGARLVVWSEVGAFVLRDEASAFERRAAAVAQDARVHLIAGLAVFAPGEGRYENVLVAFDSTGTRLARYHKARPVPGDPERGADASIPVFETALGRIAGVVCFDADFPDLIAKAGRQHADLLVIPASDWRAIDPMHTRMALVRGIENGCSVVRPTNQGLSAAADLQGRLIASTDFFRASPCVMVAQVPVHGVGTPYTRWPDAVPVLCGLVLGVALVRSVVRRRRGPALGVGT